jgi:serine protease Do
LWCLAFSPLLWAQTPTPEQLVAAQQQLVIAGIERVGPSVVAIARIRKRDDAESFEELYQPGFELLPRIPTRPDFVPHEFGSGVVLDPRGHILTTSHVLGDPERSHYVVWVSGRPFVARAKVVDPWLEVGLLQIDAEQLQPIRLGNAAPLPLGTFVLGLGNPQGIARDGRASAVFGVLTNRERFAPDDRPGQAGLARESLHQYGTLLHCDFRQEQGLSGGALVTLEGEMVGLLTTWAGQARQERPAGLAIPIVPEFVAALETLKEGRTPDYGFLGIAPGLLPLESRQKGARGVVVEDVVAGTPAARAGLVRGNVITHVGDHEVQSDLELVRHVSAVAAGTVLPLTVAEAGGKKVRKEVLLSKRPQLSPRSFVTSTGPPPWRGLRVEYVTALPNFQQAARWVDADGCVGVLAVQPDSPAWQAGLRTGECISHVGEERVSTPAAFKRAVERAGNGPVALRTASEKRTVFVEPM